MNRIPEALTTRRTDQTAVAGWRDPAMQRVSDALLVGLTWYVQGRLPLAEAWRLVAKFQERFPQLTRDRFHAHRRKAAGDPRYKLVVFANRSSSEALFWLLTDRNEDPREKWLDATGVERPRCYEYEAVRRTRAGSGTAAWTWQLTSEHFAERKAELKQAIRGDRPEMVELLRDRTLTWAGFAGVRAQHAELGKVCRNEWVRRYRAGSPPPEWPKLRYVRRLRTR